jgi:hypothetical protein
MTFKDRRVIALEESRAGLDRQREDLRQVRDRAGQIFQFGALAMGVLGALALQDKDNPNGWVIAGGACFVLLTFLIAVIWLPGSFTWTNDAATLLEAEWDRSVEEVTEHLARYQARHYSDNQRTIQIRMGVYSVALLVLCSEVVLLLVGILDG